MSDSLVSESLFMGPSATGAIGADAQNNLVELFPTMGKDNLAGFSQFVLPELKAHEAAILCEKPAKLSVPRCLIPQFDRAMLSREGEKALPCQD